MAKKAKSKSTRSTTKRSGHYVVHRRLEEPVHNLVSYSVLLALALVVLMLVLRLQ